MAQRRTDEGPVMTPKILLVAAVLAAIAIGFALPGPHRIKAEPRSQIPTLEVGKG